jgi:6-phosphogluconolactonase
MACYGRGVRHSGVSSIETNRGPAAAHPLLGCPVYELASEREVGLCAALTVIDEARRALARSGRFVVAVPGGATSLPMFACLADLTAEQGFEWEGATFVWVDERRVPYASADSNVGAAVQHGLGALSGARILGMPVAGEAEPGARAYERSLREVLRTPSGHTARIDLAVLGVGADGHVASLFPGAPALGETRRWVVPAEAPFGVRDRLTLTLLPLRAAHRRLLLATGEGKSEIVARVLGPQGAGEGLPVLMVAAGGPTTFLLDGAAAAGLAHVDRPFLLP